MLTARSVLDSILCFVKASCTHLSKLSPIRPRTTPDIFISANHNLPTTLKWI